MNQEKEYEFTEQNCLDDFKEAKFRLINKPHNAFIGSLLYDLEFNPTYEVNTVTLDSLKSTINVNPEYFCRLTHEEQATVLAHEVYHYALMHDIRRGSRDKELYQKAADEVVNNLLASSGFTLPHNVNYNKKYKNLSTEIVYNYMEKDQKDNDNSNNDTDNNPLGNDLVNNNSDGSAVKNQQNDIQQKIMKANASEEMSTGKSIDAGSFGEVFKQLFDEIKEGKLNWITILQEYLNDFSMGGFDYTQWNRRYIPMDLYLPSNRSPESIQKVALAFDVSGSVTQNQIKAFLNEMRLIKNQLDPEVMDVVSFNHNIVDIFTVNREDTLDNISMRISGGTDLEPVFNHYNKPENMPEFLIVFSDLECSPIKEPTKYNTIWICIDNPKAQVKFGKLLHITSKELEHNE